MVTRVASGVEDEALAKSAHSRPPSIQEQKPLEAGRSDSTEHLLFPMEGGEDGVAEKKMLKNAFGSVPSVCSKEEVRVGVSRDCWCFVRN